LAAPRRMNDALHGREAWRPPGKRDRGRRREVGSRVSAHHRPWEVEVKGLAEQTWQTADSAQASKYFGHYRLVLITNYRDFRLIGG
jgi:hypothetical protein